MAYDFQGLLNNPMFQIGMGLLQGSEQGKGFGGSMMQGLLNMQNMERYNQQNEIVDYQKQLRDHQLAELQRQQEKRQRIQDFMQNQPFGAPQTGGTPVQPGLFTDGSTTTPVDPATGMYASNPQVANYLQGLGQVDPEAAMGLYGQMIMREPKTVAPYSAIGKLQSDYASGRINKEQYEVGLKNLSPPGMSLEVDSQGNISFSQGSGSGMTKKTKGGLEGDVSEGVVTMDKLRGIADKYMDEYLTYQGKLKGWAGSVASKFGADLSPELKKYVAGKTKFKTSVQQFFNRYRKEITGAAASVKELELLKESMFNEDMSPVDFKAAFEDFYDSMSSQIKYKQDMLKKGVPLTQIWKNIDSGLWKESSPDKKSAPINATIDDLVKQYGGN